MKGQFTIWLFLIGILVCPSSGLTADLSLSGAVDTALSKNHHIQAARYGVLSSREKIIQARSGAIPQVQISEQLTHTTNPMWAFGTRLNQQNITTSDFNPDRLNDPDAITNYSTVLSVLWPIYDSGQTWYSLAQANLSQEAAAISESSARQQVIAETITAYIGVLLVRENKTVLQQILETARSHLQLVQSRYDGGFVAKSDLLRARVHIADLEQQMMEMKTRVDVAMCELNISMGMDSNLQYTLTSPLKPGNQVAEDLDIWVNKALSNRPELKQLKLQKQIALKEVDKSRALRYPSVSLSGNYEINSEEFKDTGTNYTVGGMVSMPLFSGGRISSKIREALVNLQQVQTHIKAMEQQVCAQTRQAFFNARSAWNRIAVARAAIEQSQESLRIVKNRYENGLFTIADLLDAELLVQQSLTRHLKAIHDYQLAVTRLDLAAGTIESSL
ncbi:MAG: TolC family protein [Proteobacteria bacterium]|nr:TolC family protein [Pseudomonadota bacterium]MBU1389783.1 TolC family protein [Pseudomonadota bacterium]MBU1543792.1 TolC family protein [Pseudomonadota bacterium]MBU2430125.1 TolC family protein [Pseudomonadota bacterium]MBU2480718.1 TolC family protein [Pseudomonadota bacterium]